MAEKYCELYVWYSIRCDANGIQCIKFCIKFKAFRLNPPIIIHIFFSSFFFRPPQMQIFLFFMCKYVLYCVYIQPVKIFWYFYQISSSLCKFVFFWPLTFISTKHWTYYFLVSRMKKFSSNISHLSHALFSYFGSSVIPSTCMCL